jgi:hypothetical protein
MPPASAAADKVSSIVALLHTMATAYPIRRGSEARQMHGCDSVKAGGGMDAAQAVAK